MDDLNKVAIGGVALIPLIVMFIQFLKSFDNGSRVPGNVWRALAFVFGVVGEVVVFLIAQGAPPWNLQTWATIVVTGLLFGLYATQAWDGVVKPQLEARAARAANQATPQGQ